METNKKEMENTVDNEKTNDEVNSEVKNNVNELENKIDSETKNDEVNSEVKNNVNKNENSEAEDEAITVPKDYFDKVISKINESIEEMKKATLATQKIEEEKQAEEKRKAEIENYPPELKKLFS